jgi:DNA topoisomerase-2
MYIGPVERQTEPAWVFEGGRMVWREVSCVPALLKLFDEVLVNAMDNVQRKSGTRSIEVRIGAAGAAEPELPAGALSIYNDGLGIPVSQATAKSHGASAAGVWLPQLVLGELYTGSNFDDGAGRTVGGRHGFGAKLANIFSHSFTVETADTRAGLFYSQTWTRNMSEVGTPVVMALGGEAKDFTRVTMRPDYSRLLGLAPGAPPLDADTLSLLVRRVHEAAACVWPDATVSLNGAPVAVEGLEGLMRLYPRSEATAVVRQLGPRWRVGVTAPPDGSFAHVSFVNGVATSRGGTHVEAVERQLLRALAPKLARALGVRAGEEPLPASALRPHLMLFVDAKVEDPDFDSQAKERLTTPIDKLGSKVELPSSFVAEVAALPWLREAVAAERRMRDARSLARAVGRAKVRRGSNLEIEKLDDAEWAGMAGKAEQCTLIVTEGDSAKALAVAGLEVVGRERWGVFPLRGKLLNVRGAVQSRVGKNEELVALMRALGVEPGAKVSLDPETGAAVGLRYGRLMLMTDQDEDGAHIKGLVISMLHHFWPALTRGSFVQEFVTPLLKAHRRKQGGSVEFYSLAAYDRWRAALPASEAAAWRTKYYKGLGTSTAAEAREYFRAMHRHRVQLTTSDESRADDLIDMAFSPARAADRKEWMNKAIAEEEAGGGQGVRGQPEAGEGLTEAGEEAAAGEVAVREAEAGGEVAAREVAAAAGAITPMGPDGDASASATVCLELLQLGVKELKQEARRLGVSPIPKSKDDLLRAVEQASAAETRDAALSAAAALATPASRSLESFVQGDLVHFSLSALRRSLPSVVDGLKPSQRKASRSVTRMRGGQGTQRTA